MERQGGVDRAESSQEGRTPQAEAQMLSASSEFPSEIAVTRKTEISDRSGSSSSSSSSNSNGQSSRDYLKAIGMDPSRFWPKKYRFTREKPTGNYNPLTISQRNFYETNGYIVFDDCVGKKLLDSLRGSYNGGATNLEPALVDKMLLRNDKLLQYVKCFCDERIMLMTYRLLDSFQTDTMRDVIDNGQQQRQMLSRDWMYLPFRPIDKVCCAVTAIEPLEHTLLVVPGTHKIGQCSISSTLDRGNSAAGGTEMGAGVSEQERAQTVQTREIFECSPERLSDLVDKSKKGFKYIDLKPGQTLFYHPGLIHGFSADLINFRRKQLISIAYYAAADCEYIDLRDQLSAEWASVGRAPIPLGLGHFEPNKSPVDYTSWLDKPRLIHNRDASF